MSANGDAELELSPKDVEFVMEELLAGKVELKYGGYNRLSKRERLAVGLHILSRTTKGETQREIAAELDISQATVSRLKDMALDTIRIPTQEKAARDYLEVCEAEIRFYQKRREGEDDTSATDRMLAHWHEQRAKVLGTYAPERTETTVTVETQAERELRELLEQADRDEAARVASLQKQKA